MCRNLIDNANKLLTPRGRVRENSQTTTPIHVALASTAEQRRADVGRQALTNSGPRSVTPHLLLCLQPHTTPFSIHPPRSIMPIAVGETIPKGEFGVVEYSPELEDASVCGMPSKVSTESWKGKKIVVFGVPGAFTPTCSVNHLPPYLEKFEELKSKGVDAVYCLASNDVFVMSAWGRVLKTSDKITMIADSSLAWLEAAGLVQDLSHVGFGKRASRFAAVIDDLKVTYIGIESGGGVGPSGVDAVLAKL